MKNEEYEHMLDIINEYFQKDIIISFPNGLKVKCNAFHGMAESDTEPGDEDYIGYYYTFVNEVEIISEGNDDSIAIYNNCIEISLKCIPETIETLDGALLWQRT